MKTSKIFSMLLLAAAAAFGPTTITGEPSAKTESLTADEIVAKANHVAYYQGDDGRARLKMTIVDAQKRTRLRDMTVLRWDARPGKKPETQPGEKAAEFTGEQKFYIYFHEPADVNRMAFLVHKHLDKDDDRWLYLPKLDLVKRIAGSEKRTSFVGSESLDSNESFSVELLALLICQQENFVL